MILYGECFPYTFVSFPIMFHTHHQSRGNKDGNISLMENETECIRDEAKPSKRIFDIISIKINYRFIKNLYNYYG